MPNVKIFSLVILSCYFIQVRITNVLQPEFFDTQEQISEEELRNLDFGHDAQQTPPPSPTSTNPLSERSLGSPGLADRLPYMRLLPPPTDKHYPTFNALIEDVNKTTSRQGYNVVKSGGNKKDMNRDLWKVRLGCSKRKSYNEEGEVVRLGVRQRRRQATDCQWKAYATRKDGNWYLRVEEPEHNHPPSAPEAFSINRQFLPADMAVIKDDIKAHIPPVKMLARHRSIGLGELLTGYSQHQTPLISTGGVQSGPPNLRSLLAGTGSPF